MINCQQNQNDYISGVLYTGQMDESTILEGLKSVIDTKAKVEIIMHPSTNEMKRSNYQEFLTLKNPELKQKIQDLGFKF